MSDKERIIQLLDSVPDYKMGYVLAYVQGIAANGEIPNRITVEAMEELEEGKGKVYNTASDLWQNLEE